MGRLTVGVLICAIICPAPYLLGTEPQAVDVQVAVYFSTIDDYAAELVQALNCSWLADDTTYRLIPTIIDWSDVMGLSDTPLDAHHFDVLAIPGSGRPYIDAMNPLWKAQVVSFVAHGGGFLGVCGGANLASMGFREPGDPHTVLDGAVLRITNVYVNDQQFEEWQYLWKANWEQGMPPIAITFCHTNNPIFADWYGQNRSVRYGGGPGMYPADGDDPLLGPLTPLAIYAEEPMAVAPLHFWQYRGDWAVHANVTTDIKGQYAALATTYGSGRVVLFSPHPEKPTWFGGQVAEFPVRPHLGPLTWFIYNWTGGNLSEESYNWWMLQRSVAWLAGVPLPPTHLSDETPSESEGLRFQGRLIMPLETKMSIR
jgi:hypothetical protein